MNSPAHCYAIPASQPFLRVLAGWILEHYGNDAAMLPKTLILLPTRRACRSLRDAFLDVTGGKPLLLPRIRPIGDLDEESLLWPETLTDALPAAIAPMRRELLLTGLVMAFRARQSAYGIEQAAKLARELAHFIDEVAREGLDFNGLSALAPEELAAHWQQTLDFLTIVSQQWPAILAEENAIDAAAHRNLLLKATADAWRRKPPSHPIIAAGSTGSIPATARLLKVIAHLPQGRVVLPGLDLQMPAAEWEMIGETHPQYALRQLLKMLECKRETVSVIGKDTMEGVSRSACLRTVLQPAEVTAHWPQTKLPLTDGLSGVGLIAADTQADEARMIAIALREVLETPGKTAALVTPDRTLARMVAAQMQRFGVTIDDSAGCELRSTNAGCFLRLVIDMVASQAAPAPLLALLRHPLAAAGLPTAECRRLSRALELELLRGIRRAPGLDALARSANQPGVKSLLGALAEKTRTLAHYFSGQNVSLTRLFEAHMALAEWLATTDQMPGAQRLWAGEAGAALADFLNELLPHAGLVPAVDPVAYPGLFDALLSGHSYRPSYGLHPRLHILSAAEARLQQFDQVILGGLNEGTWPAAPDTDPWMSRPMRAAFGLPAAQRATGQSAHDIWMLAMAPEVLLTRARKVDGSPAVPSRWLVRLETLLEGLSPASLKHLHQEARYEQGKALLDAPQLMPVLKRPQPAPPLDARPARLSVTAIDRWLADPYVIYAQYVLKLRKLSPLDEDPDAADFGELVHNALARFTAAWPNALPQNAQEKLLECGRAEFAKFIDRPAVMCLWWPRFESVANWMVAQETLRRPSVQQVSGEITGTWELAANGRVFTLSTRIDRLEIGKDGTATVADYKTGSVPAQSKVERGEANQLPLEALIAQYGNLQYTPTPNQPIGGRGIHLEYWKLSGNPDQCEIQTYAQAENLIQAARQRLEQLVAHYNNASTPYEAALDSPSDYNDYEQLTRRLEWGEV